MVPGRHYHARVRAWNGVSGVWGPARYALPAALWVAGAAPAVQQLDASAWNADQLQATWVLPTSLQPATVVLEVDNAAPLAEVQRLDIRATRVDALATRVVWRASCWLSARHCRNAIERCRWRVHCGVHQRCW
jgi:hypothetical protein